MLVEEIPDRNGGFRNIACLRFLQNAVDTGANREGIPPGRRDEADALMSEGVEMTQTECTAGFIAVSYTHLPYTAHFDAGCGRAVDLITGQEHDFGGGSELPGYSAYFWKCER